MGGIGWCQLVRLTVDKRSREIFSDWLRPRCRKTNQVKAGVVFLSWLCSVYTRQREDNLFRRLFNVATTWLPASGRSPKYLIQQGCVCAHICTMQILAGGQYFRGRVSFVSGGGGLYRWRVKRAELRFQHQHQKRRRESSDDASMRSQWRSFLGFFFGWLFGENDFPSWGWQGQKARQGRWAEPGISWRQANPVVFYWMWVWFDGGVILLYRHWLKVLVWLGSLPFATGCH